MKYCRINLQKTFYDYNKTHWEFIKQPNIKDLNQIYYNYCNYKKFKSVMPIFDSQYINNDVIGYYDNNKLVAFSLIQRYDLENIENIQFAWDYNNPDLTLGLKSLEIECAVYKELGFKYFYLGSNDNYKKQFQGYEILGELSV